MTILSADYITELIELPMPVLLSLVGVGFVLAVTGWRWHRFWLTVSISLVAGVIGLKQSSNWGVEQPIMAALLLATAAGCLSLSLARVGLFLAYGLGCWYAMKRFAPEYAIPVICVCAGGLFSVFFYRFCVILLTSSVGSLMVAYGGMAYAEQSKLFSALPWLQEQSLTLHGALAGFLLTTMVVQLYTTRRLRRRIKNECTREELESERRLGFSVKDRAA